MFVFVPGRMEPYPSTIGNLRAWWTNLVLCDWNKFTTAQGFSRENFENYIFPHPIIRKIITRFWALINSFTHSWHLVTMETSLLSATTGGKTCSGKHCRNIFGLFYRANVQNICHFSANHADLPKRLTVVHQSPPQRQRLILNISMY